MRLRARAQAARAAIEAEAGIPIDVVRFRPNLFVSTPADAPASPFPEDAWAAVEAGAAAAGGALRFRSVKPCTRCNVPDVDPATGVPDKGKQTSAALRALRKGGDLAETQPAFQERKWAGRTFFAWNLVAETRGHVAVGDAVTAVAVR